MQSRTTQQLGVCMILSTPMPPVEGIGFYVWNLSLFLTKLGHQVHIITRGRPAHPSRESINDITIWRPAFLPVFPLHAQVHSFFVGRILREIEPEIDLIHIHTPLVAAPRTKKPILVTVHTALKSDISNIQETGLHSRLIDLQAPFSYAVEKRLFEAAGSLTAVASSVAQELADYHIAPARVHVLGNGVDTRIFHPPSEAFDKTNPYALTVARLAPRKGLMDLIPTAIKVTAEVPGFRFLIAGSGSLKRDLQAEISRHNLEDHVILLGHIDDRARLADLYRQASVYVHPAHYEGLPTVLLEAMACGTPVVATAVSGALDVIEDGQNGLLVPPQAPAQLAKAILRVLNAPQESAAWGAAGAATIRERFSWASISRQYVEHYHQLLTEHHGEPA